MKVHVNVFTPGLGYSEWDLDLGFTVLPKYLIKRHLKETMNKWFHKGNHIYLYTLGNLKHEESNIVHIYFYKNGKNS